MRTKSERFICEAKSNFQTFINLPIVHFFQGLCKIITLTDAFAPACTKSHSVFALESHSLCEYIDKAVLSGSTYADVS